MTLRKVLLLTYHFPPSGAVAVYRMIALARYLPKFGWQPIITAPPRVPWEPEDESLLAHVPPETPIERVPFASGLFGKFVRRLAPEAHWLWRARGACRRMIETHRPSAILTSSPPSCVHWLGMRLQRKYGLPWLADFRDPWFTNRTAVEQRELGRCQRWLEAKAMKRANVLIANTPLNLQGWTAAFPQEAHKMVTITNGFDPERFPPLAERPSNDGKLKVLHAGELYCGRNPGPLLDAIKPLHEAGQLLAELEFLGRNTGGEFDLAAEIRNRGLNDCVQQTGQLPYAEAVARMMRADILLLLQAPDNPVGVPAKLYEYLGAGRPILALAEPEGDVAWVLRESKVLHRIAPPGNVERIRTALLELIGEIQTGRRAVLDTGAVRRFTREGMAQRFAECLDRVVK